MAKNNKWTVDLMVKTDDLQDHLNNLENRNKEIVLIMTNPEHPDRIVVIFKEE